MIFTACSGGQGYISLVPQWASISNRVFSQFIDSLPFAKSEPSTPREPLDDRLRRALEYLAELSGDVSLIDAKEPLSSMSFSRLSYNKRQAQVDNYMAAARKQKGAYSPLDSEGRPIRLCVHSPTFHCWVCI